MSAECSRRSDETVARLLALARVRLSEDVISVRVLAVMIDCYFAGREDGLANMSAALLKPVPRSQVPA